MNQRIEELLGRLRQAESDLEEEFQARRREFSYRVERDRVQFEARVAALHARFKQSLPAFLRGARLLNILTSPVIYGMIVPLVLLDLSATVYQYACFPGYGVARVSRGKYIVHDRHLLNYLNGIERLNCYYCSYANGLIAYVREIASRTEQYFCPIKHAVAVLAAHQRYPRFLEYGDAEGFRPGLETLRDELRREGGPSEGPRPPGGT